MGFSLLALGKNFEFVRAWFPIWNCDVFFFWCYPRNFGFWCSGFACGPWNAGQFMNFGFGFECHAECR